MWRAQTCPPSLSFLFLVRNWYDFFRVVQIFVQDSSPQIFPLRDPSHGLPPHGRLSQPQASYSKQHVAWHAAGRAPGHHLSCLPHGDNAALCASLAA